MPATSYFRGIYNGPQRRQWCADAYLLLGFSSPYYGYSCCYYFPTPGPGRLEAGWAVHVSRMRRRSRVSRHVARGSRAAASRKPPQDLSSREQRPNAPGKTTCSMLTVIFPRRSMTPSHRKGRTQWRDKNSSRRRLFVKKRMHAGSRASGALDGSVSLNQEKGGKRETWNRAVRALGTDTACKRRLPVVLRSRGLRAGWTSWMRKGSC